MAVRPVYCMTLLTGLVLCTTFLISLRMPLSLFYSVFHSEDAMRDRASTLNSARHMAAVKHVRSLETQTVTRPMFSTEASMAPDIVIVIVTVARKDSLTAGYLTQTVSALDKVLQSDNNFQRKLLVICNVDNHPDNHAEAVQLQSKFHFVRRHGMNSLGIRVHSNQTMLNTGLVDKARIKETEDYVFCLDTSYLLNSKYVLILEDDVIPHRNVLDVVHFTLKFKLGSHDSLLVRNKSTFAFLKLYYPLKWQGFGLEIDKFLECYGLSLICGAIISGLLFRLNAITRRRNTCSYTNLYLYGVVLSFTVALIIGRVNVDQWRRISSQLYKLESSSACCTQAMLFDRNVIPKLTNHLLVNNSLNKDLAIYEFAQRHSMPGLQLEPNLFLHIGLSTSLSSEKKDPEEFLFDKT